MPAGAVVSRHGADYHSLHLIQRVKIFIYSAQLYQSVERFLLYHNVPKYVNSCTTHATLGDRNATSLLF